MTLLYLIYPTTENHIICEDNVVTLLKKLVINYNCNSEIVICQNSSCQKSEETKYPLIAVNANTVWNKGIQFLQDSVTETIEDKNVYCQHCHHSSATRRFIIDKYILLDIEHFYEKSIFVKKNNIRFPNTTLSDLPTILRINDKQFHLCGAVEFIPSKISNGLGHYVAYTRSICNKWKRIDDLQKEATYYQTKTPDVQISILLYVQGKYNKINNSLSRI